MSIIWKNTIFKLQLTCFFYIPKTDNSTDVIIQADMLLLAGSCIVDEAVLTGESTPQWKNPIGEATGDEVDASELAPSSRLSIKRDKMHVVFGGTKLMQSTGDKQAHVKTPDGGCLAVVLRTGFGTAQGRQIYLLIQQYTTAIDFVLGLFKFTQ